MPTAAEAAEIRQLMKQPETAERNARINALARGKPVPPRVPTKTKSPLSIKETVFKEPDVISTRTPDLRKSPDPDTSQMTPESKLHFIRSVTGHGKENIPKVVKDLGPSAEREYAITAFKTQTGIISPEKGTQKIQSDFEARLKKGSEPTSIRWMKEHGTFTSEGKEYSWSELKEKHPRLEIDRYGGEFIVSEKPIDYTAWRKEQYKYMDPFSATVRRGSATFLGGFASLDYAYAGHTGDPTDIKGQQKKLGAIIDKWEYDTTHAIKSGNILGVATGIPAVTNILAPYGMGVGIGALFKGVYGASAALVNRGFKHTGTALKWGAKGTGIGIGTLAVGTAGYDVYSTYQHDPDKATLKALTYGTQFTSFGIGMKTGMDVSLKTIKAKQLNIKQPNITFKGGYRSGGPTLVGRGRSYSTPNLMGRGKSYTPMKNVVYTPTSPSVVASKAKVHFASIKPSSPTLKWGYKSGQPNITFKGGYRPGSPKLVGRDRPYSSPILVGKGKPYTPMKNVVYKPTSPGVVAGKAKVHFERFLDSKSFLYKKPEIVQKIDPYSLKGLNKLFGEGKTTKRILDREPFFEITKPSGKTTIFKPSSVDTFSPSMSGKNVLLTKIKSVVTSPKTTTKTISLSVPTTGKTTFGKLPVMGFSKIKGGGILSKIWGRRLSLSMLAASEEGVYTGAHTHWAGIAPIIIPKSYTSSIFPSISALNIGSSYLQKPLSIVSIDSVGLSHSIKSSDIISTSINVSDTKQILDNITTPVTITTPVSITKTTPISISDTKQILDNITTPIPVTTIDIMLKPLVYKPLIVKTHIYKPPPPPVKILDFSPYKKKKQVDPFKKYFSGYRFRTWKVPSMKDIMKGVF